MSKADASFPKSRRILKRPDFQRIMKTGLLRRGDRLVCYIVEKPGEDTRIGFLVSRKFGNAVARNRIKRLLREAFRNLKGEIPEGMEIIALPTKKPEYTLDGFTQDMRKLLCRTPGGGKK